MLYLKCTADVQKTIGLHKSQLSPIESSEAPLGHWMVNRFMVERRNAYVFMSESTLLSFILLSGKVPMTPQRLPDMLIGGLVQLLQLRGLPGDAIARAIDPYVECRYAQNDNRAAMGCMNDLVGRYQSMIDYMGGLARCDLTEIIFKMNNTPQRTIGWAYSWDVAESKLRALS